MAQVGRLHSKGRQPPDAALHPSYELSQWLNRDISTIKTVLGIITLTIIYSVHFVVLPATLLLLPFNYHSFRQFDSRPIFHSNSRLGREPKSELFRITEVKLFTSLMSFLWFFCPTNNIKAWKGASSYLTMLNEAQWSSSYDNTDSPRWRHTLLKQLY